MADSVTSARPPSAKLRRLGNSDVRQHNLSAVLRAVHDEAPSSCSRSQVMRTTGLTKAAVGALVSELIGYGLLAEEASVRAGVGRPTSPLRVRYERFAAAVLDVGVTYVTTSVCDLAGDVIWQETDLSHATVGYDMSGRLDLIRSRALEAVDTARASGRRIVGVVVAAHSITDPARGLVPATPDHEQELAVVEEIRRGLPPADPPFVIVENDSFLATLADWERYRREGVANVVSLSGELSLGTGLVLGGQLYRGSHGYAGQFGHLPVDPDGPPCSCGQRGCWKVVVGLRHVLRQALPNVAARLEHLSGYAPVGVAALVAAAQSGDEEVLRALAQAGRWLGAGAANIANALDPDLIVAGAYFPALSQWVMPAAWDTLRARSFRSVDPERLLVVSDLDTAAYHTSNVDLERSRVFGGGLHCVIEKLIDQPAGWD